MRTETITLAGTEYEIRELPLRRNAEWRQLVADKYAEFAELIGGAANLELTDTSNVVELLRRAGEMVFHAPDMLVDLTLDYAPELRDALGDDVYESELMEAFAACLRLAFPFGKLTRLLTSLAQTGSVPSSKTT